MRRGRKGWAIKKTKFLHSRNCSKNRATEAMKRIEQVLSVIIIFIFDDKKKKKHSTSIAHQKTHAQLQGEKNTRAPENCPNLVNIMVFPFVLLLGRTKEQCIASFG